MDNAYEGVMQWIAQARAAGLSDTQVAEQLAGQGWQADQIQRVLTPAAPAPMVQPAVAPKQTPTESVRTEIQQAFDPSVKVRQKSWPMRHLVLLASVLGGLIVLGGVAFAAIRGYIPIPFLNKSTLQDQLVKAIDVISGAKSGEIGLALSVKLEPHDGTSKRLPEAAAGAVSPAQARTLDSQLASNAGQIRTGLALYYDTHNAFPDGLTVLATEKFLSKLPDEVKDHPITYTVSEDHQQYTLQYTCVSDGTKTGKIDYKAGTATSCSNGSTSVSLFDTFDTASLFQYLPSDMQLQGKIATFVGEQDVNGKKTARGYVTLNGSYASGGTTISVDGELRMQDGKYYGIVRQFPSLFFIDLTSLKEKWVLIDPAAGDTTNDIFPLESVTDEAPSSNDLGKAKIETVTFIRKALDVKAVVLTRQGSEDINGRRLSKVKITMDPAQLPAAVTAYKDDATKRNALNKDVGQMLDELVKPENLDRMRVVAGQTSLTVWMENLNATPHKLQLETVIVPPEKVEKLKGKQVRLSIALTFEHLGEQPKVEVPANPISLDEAERLITGITEEQQKFDKQRGAVDDLRTALGNYKAKNGTYPKDLAALLEKPPASNAKTGDVQASAVTIEEVPPTVGLEPQTSATAKNYFSTYSSRTVIPKDVFTGKDFPYQTSDSGYQFTYQMTLPKESDTSDMFGGSSYYTDQYVNGTNTATQDLLSVEKQTEKDKKAGVTPEQRAKATQFNNQKIAVQNLRAALAAYSAANSTFPATLGELTAQNASTKSTYLNGKSVPTDVITGKPFSYSGTKSSYTFTYTMHLPSKASQNYVDGLPYVSAYDLSQYSEGTNTATQSSLSVEVLTKKGNVPVSTVTGVNVNGYMLSYPPVSTLTTGGVTREYFYFVQNPEGDQTTMSVGLRLERNANRLTLQQWYKGKFNTEPTGTEETVDAFPALRVGRSIYVAANWKAFGTSAAEPYVCVLSYEKDTKAEAVKVFDAFVKSLSFTNLPLPTASTSTTAVPSTVADTTRT